MSLNKIRVYDVVIVNVRNFFTHGKIAKILDDRPPENTKLYDFLVP